jgi:hypothetical protein
MSRSPATGQAGLFAGGIKPAENIFYKYRIMMHRLHNQIFPLMNRAKTYEAIPSE